MNYSLIIFVCGRNLPIHTKIQLIYQTLTAIGIYADQFYPGITRLHHYYPICSLLLNQITQIQVENKLHLAETEAAPPTTLHPLTAFPSEL
jgi:hypothetical protein